MNKIIIALLVAGMAAAALIACNRESADLIVVNGRVWTQYADAPEVQAVAVRDGLVLAVGGDEEVMRLRGDATVVLDAGGRRVVPGLNDSHQHPTRGGRFYAAELRWDGVKTLKRALEMVAEQAKRTPEGEWVRVIGGWSPFQFEEKRMPTPQELTEAAPDTPVYVLYLYSQGFLNKAGIEALGITAQTEVPAGTRYEIGEDGEPTGRILAEPNPNLLYMTIGALPHLSKEHQVLSTSHYYRELNRFGLTSVIDAGGGGHLFPRDYSGTEVLAEQGEMPIRLSHYLFPQRPGKEFEDFERWSREFKINVNMAKYLLGGYVLCGGGEFLVWKAGDFENFMSHRHDLRDREGWREELMAVVRLLLQREWPIRIHATYDESINLILDVFEEADRLEKAEGRAGFSGIRWAIDHAETAKPATLARIKEMGGGVAIQARMAYAGEYFKDRYGAEAAEHAPPFRDVLDLGIPLGLGSDATRVASYNPWLTLYWATTGRSVGGEQLHSGRHLLSREEALYLHTVGSAWFSGEQDIKGTLAPGQLADFAVLSDDYFSVSDEALRSIESVLTVTGGNVVYGAEEFAELVEPLAAIQPEWSPVRVFGGYQR